MTDAAPLKQYLSTDVFGRHHVIYFVDGETTLPDGSIYKGLAVHSYWTLGPLIDDLLRDAARYRWLRQLYYAGENEAGESTYLWPGTEHHVRHTAEIFGKRIDAEIAQGRADG